jgi:DEAD/DEAH box helicase domain-containing protein
MHDAETFLVDDLNLQERVAYVHRADVDYYTQSVSDTQILINSVVREKEWSQARVSFGNVSVTDTVVLFKKIKFGSRESIGYGEVKLPPQVLHTTACWFTPPASAIREMLRWGCVPAEGMLGLSNVLAEVVGLFAMCDRQDIGTTVDVKTTGAQAIFIYDKYPGGLGFGLKAYDLLPEILGACRQLVSECGCEGGCPSCVGSPIPPFAQQDPDTQGKGRIPDKEACLILLHALLGLEAYRPRDDRRPVEVTDDLPGIADEEPVTRPREDRETAQRPVKRLPKEVELRLRELLEETRGTGRSGRGNQ